MLLKVFGIIKSEFFVMMNNGDKGLCLDVSCLRVRLI